MKITYAENPLATVVELDDHEKEVFRLKIMVHELEERFFSAGFALEKDPPDLDRVRRNINVVCIDKEKDEDQSPLEKRVDELLEHFLAALQDTHAGDCTCFPCSCEKCWAESILGIHTTKGLGKHAGSQVYHAFEEGKSLDEVIASLENYNPTRNEAWLKSDPDGKLWESCLPGWTKTARAAAEWLKTYKATHLIKEI